MKKFLNYKNVIALLLVLFSSSGLYASFILMTEKILLLKDTSHVLSCDLNTVISCGSVMKSAQAEVFGFPNTILGLIGYGLILTVGMFMVFGGKVNRYFYILANFGVLLAFIFSYWLLFQSVYRIGALCPYCLVSCFSSTNLFFAMIYFNLKENNFNFRDSINVKINYFLSKLWFVPVIAIWYVVIVSLVILRFNER